MAVGHRAEGRGQFNMAVMGGGCKGELALKEVDRKIYNRTDPQD